MPFIPFAATVGAALGGSATLGGIAIAAGAASIASTVVSSQQAAKQAKSANAAAAQAQTQNAAAIKEVKDAQGMASVQAQTLLAARRRATAGSQTIFTSPLGITEQAAVNKKTLLGQ